MARRFLLEQINIFIFAPGLFTLSSRNQDKIYEMSALSDASSRQRETTPLCTGITSGAIPRAEKTPQGVSVEYTPDVTKSWYVLRVSYGRAFQAKGFLESNDISCYLPIHRVVRMVNNKRKHVREPLLPSLIFAYANAEHLRLFVNDKTRNSIVSYYYNHFSCDAYGKNPPLTIDYDCMMNFIRLTSVDDEHIRIVDPNTCRYKSGDMVRVTEGKFKGVVGRVARVAQEQRVVVEIEGVCMVATAYIPSGFIEIVDARGK